MSWPMGLRDISLVQQLCTPPRQRFLVYPPQVWNVSTKESQALVGHTMNVRGLLWHSEIPYLCMTGSWDSTIRLWDVRTAICITVRLGGARVANAWGLIEFLVEAKRSCLAFHGQAKELFLHIAHNNESPPGMRF